MKVLSRKCFLVLLALVFRGFHADADTVKFTNGDVLTGEVLGLVSGKMKFKTAALGTVDISMDAVQSIDTENNLKVKLTDGTEAIGRITGGAFVGKDGSRVDNLAVSQLEGIYTLEMIELPKQKLSGEFLLGGTSQKGNTDIQSVYLRTKLSLSEVLLGGNADPFSFKAEYYLSEDSGRMNARNGSMEIRYDNEFWKKTAYFLQQKTSFDQFRNIDLRAEEQFGLAQTIFREPKWYLKGDFGFTRIDTFFDDASPSEGDFGIVFGGHFLWDIFSNLQFTHDASLRPTFGSFSDYLLSLESALSSRLSENWNVKLIHQVFYDNQPTPGTAGTDKTIIVTLGYTF